MKKNKKKRFIQKLGRITQKTLITALIFGVMMIMTACDELPEDLQLAISEAFSARASLNEGVANQLLASGIISENTHTLLVKNIQTNLSDFGSSIKKADSGAGKNLLKSIVGWRVIPEDVHSSVSPYPHLRWDSPGSNTGWALGFVTNAVLAHDAGLLSNVPILGGNSKVIKPIEVISESLITQLNSELGIPIYTLKPDLANNVGIDGVMEAVSLASSKKDESGLSQYFAPATYLNDKSEEVQVTFLDPTDPDQQLVRMTMNDKGSVNKSGTAIEHVYPASTQTGNSISDTSKKCGAIPEGQPFQGKFNTTLNHYMGFPATSEGENRLGRDMTMFNGGQAVLSVRLVEFNQDAVDYLYANIGVGENRYLVLNNRAYLMEYPVGYISGFKETEDREGYKSIIEESEIGFNLLTGKFSKFDKNSDGTISATSHPMDDNDPYITYNGAVDNLDETKASLVFYGSTGLTTDDVSDKDDDFLECNPPWDYELGEYIPEGSTTKKPRLVNMGRIVLRDYLEATYAPGVVSGDSLVVLGRKLRVLHLDGDKGGSESVAQLYDKEGNVIEYNGQPVRLYINDFADIDALLAASPKVKYISDSKEEIGDATSGSTDSGDTDSTDSGDTDSTESSEDQDSTEESTSSSAIQSNITKIDRIATEIVNKVKVSTKFPGPHIDAGEESSTDTKPMFYAMVVKKNIFETGLFSGWINNTDVSKNSLGWWNQWLQDHGFNYKINSDSLTEYLSGNYAFELTKEGIIVLDLQTIAKIQEEFNQDTKTHTAEFLHTVFLVLGYILVAYSILLLIAWNVDVNVDLGFNVLEKLSFGRWIAVKDYDELPYMNTDEINYVKFGDLLVSCIVIITTGIILITVNIVDLILMLIQLFGGLARYVTGILTGR